MKPGDTLAVLGLGPIGEMATRVAQHLGIQRVLAEASDASTTFQKKQDGMFKTVFTP